MDGARTSGWCENTASRFQDQPVILSCIPAGCSVVFQSTPRASGCSNYIARLRKSLLYGFDIQSHPHNHSQHLFQPYELSLLDSSSHCSKPKNILKNIFCLYMEISGVQNNLLICIVWTYIVFEKQSHTGLYRVALECAEKCPLRELVFI